jgi:predicted dienelactone hydrolase
MAKATRGRSRRRLTTPLLVLSLGLACVTETPPPPTAADEPGPYTIAAWDTSFSDSNGLYGAKVQYPTSAAGAPYPAVVVAPGLCANESLNHWIGDHLATFGYVVLTFTPPDACFGGPPQRRDGLIDGLAYLVSQAADPASPVFGLVDPTKRGIVGHSQGADGALMASLAHPTIGASVPMAPSRQDASFLEPLVVPTQIQAGELDCMLPPDQAADDYDRLVSASRMILTIKGANHTGFNDEGSLYDVIGPLIGDCARTIDASDHQQRLSRRYFTAWFQVMLKGDASYLTYLDGAQAEADVAAGLFTDFRSNL